jgi:hypothetical protein
MQRKVPNGTFTVAPQVEGAAGSDAARHTAGVLPARRCNAIDDGDRRTSRPHTWNGQHMNSRTLASFGSIALGVLLIIGSIGTWVLVSSTLAEQNITTPDDACLPGREVAGPFTAYCQAEIIQKHAMESTGGLTYAELDREDPLRNVAMNASFLQASLFTSVLAFGVAAMALGMGLIFILIGLGMRDVKEQIEVVQRT